MKEFTFKQVAILVLVLVVGFAFLQTSDPIWSLSFLKDFFNHLWGYLLAAVFLLVLLASFGGGKNRD